MPDGEPRCRSTTPPCATSASGRRRSWSLAGKEYGTGSSRDWAAKGPALLGVQGRHRRELRAHPPLATSSAWACCRSCSSAGEGAESLGLDGSRDDLDRRASRRLTPRKTLAVKARQAGRRARSSSSVTARVDTPRSRSTTCSTAASCPTCCARSPGERTPAERPARHAGQRPHCRARAAFGGPRPGLPAALKPKRRTLCPGPLPYAPHPTASSSSRAIPRRAAPRPA
ncbi:MAG: hypothetical protein MZV49_12895 [Rhodopseudomonas palustris]|nr:hypothetical protein [Rhodopseudomonas palustris]